MLVLYLSKCNTQRMKRKQLVPIALIFIAASALILFYKPEPIYKEINGEAQGTFYNIKYLDVRRRNLQPKIDQQLHKFDLSLSSYNTNSTISKINRNEKNVKLDKLFKTVFNKSEEIYHISDGAFDITVGTLANAWGFGTTERVEVDSSYIDSILNFVGMDKVSIVGNYLVKEDSSILLNVNAIAQGYSVDVICNFLERKGVTDYLVEIGGELKAKGVNKQDVPWKIGIDKPIDNNMEPGKNLQAIIELNNSSLATSGNYRKFYEENGVKYAHSINPKTGYPELSRLLSVTVLTKECITADGLATAFMVMGLEKTILFLSDHKGLDAYLVYSDDNGSYKTYMTPGMKNAILKEMK